MTRLILWDVDHTLIESRGVGGEVFAEAFRAVTGRDLLVPAQAQGVLEPQLFAAACQANGVDGDPARLFPEFADVQARLYRERAAELAARGRVLPGVRAALESLAGRKDVVSSVLTGNTPGAGRAKLEAFGLSGLLDLDVAAWGTDAATRAELPEVAWRHGSGRMQAFGPRNTVIVGDTPSDVAAGKTAGCRVVAVATGRFTVADLAGADVVLEDLADTSAVPAALRCPAT